MKYYKFLLSKKKIKERNRNNFDNKDICSNIIDHSSETSPNIVIAKTNNKKIKKIYLFLILYFSNILFFFSFVFSFCNFFN